MATSGPKASVPSRESGVQRRPALAILIVLITLAISARFVYSLQVAVPAVMPSHQSPDTLTFSGHIGGPAQALAIVNDTLVAAVGPELATFSLADPDNPLRLAYRIYSENLNSLNVSGTVAYLSDGNLHLLDVGDPTDLRPISSVSIPGTILNSGVAGNLVVTVGSNFSSPHGQLRIFDVSTPTLPLELSLISYPIEARAVAITDTFAIVANDTSGLQIVDISVPTAPHTVLTRATIGQAYDIALRGNYGFVVTVSCAFNCTGGVQIFDLSDPIDPLHVDFIPLPSQPATLTLHDDFLLVANGAAGLALIDVSDPTKAQLLGVTDLPEKALGVAATGNDAFLATGRGGIQHVTISPTLPGGSLPSFNNAFSVRFHDEYALVGDGQGLFVIDTTAPHLPTITAFTATPAAVVAQTSAGDHLYLALQLAGLQIYNISDPLTPQLVGSFNTPGSVNGVLIDGDYAYLADGSTGLRILDISDPANPQPVADVDTAGIAWDVAKEGNILYVADFDRGLRIFDVSDPADLAEIGLYNTPGDAQAVVVADDLAYIADGVNGVRIIDVTDPQNPFEVGAYENFRHTYDLELVGHYVYATNDSGGLMTIDVSDPTMPFEVVRRDSAGQGWGVAVDPSRHLLGLADRFGGFYLFEQAAVDLGGFIRQANSTGFAGVTISSDLSGMALSDGQGRFDFATPILGQQQLTPALPGFVFWPSSQTINLPPTQADVRFTILPESVQTVVNPGSSALLSYMTTAGVTTTLRLPAGAVNETTNLVLTPTLTTPPLGLSFAAQSFELAAYQGDARLGSFSFNLPVAITVDYSEADLSTIGAEAGLDLYWTAGEPWQAAGFSCLPPIASQLDITQNRLRSSLCETGSFALFGPPKQLFLPIIVRP